uniref:ubiquitinyl hydrolase 1 n=1 Tax=Timema cristinae TaxID=61476 RepID=A0A7R9H1Y4_TIMCR|nr:unnamed protein product [Timema cristinae]
MDKNSSLVYNICNSPEIEDNQIESQSGNVNILPTLSQLNNSFEDIDEPDKVNPVIGDTDDPDSVTCAPEVMGIENTWNDENSFGSPPTSEYPIPLPGPVFDDLGCLDSDPPPIEAGPFPESDLGTLFSTEACSQDDVRDSTASPGVCGLKNMGNTCFMGAGLQCLAATPALIRFFLNRAPGEKELPHSLTDQFSTLIHKIWSGEFCILHPIEFKQALGIKHPQFKDYRQHDCQEFLALLLDNLHEQLNAASCKSVMSDVSTAPDTPRSQFEVSDEKEPLAARKLVGDPVDMESPTQTMHSLDGGRSTSSESSVETRNVFRLQAIPEGIKPFKDANTRDSHDLSDEEMESANVADMAEEMMEEMVDPSKEEPTFILNINSSGTSPNNSIVTRNFPRKDSALASVEPMLEKNNISGQFNNKPAATTCIRGFQDIFKDAKTSNVNVLVTEQEANNEIRFDSEKFPKYENVRRRDPLDTSNLTEYHNFDGKTMSVKRIKETNLFHDVLEPPDECGRSEGGSEVCFNNIKRMRLEEQEKNVRRECERRQRGMSNETANSDAEDGEMPGTSGTLSYSQAGVSEEFEADKNWEKHLSANQSVIVDTFQGQFKSTVVCAACRHVSVTYEPFMYLSVPLPHAMEKQICKFARTQASFRSSSSSDVPTSAGTSSSLLVTFSLPLRNLLISSCYILTASQEPPHLFLLHSHCLSGTSSSLLVTFSLPLRNLLISSCYILTASQEPPHLFLLHSHCLSGTSSSLLVTFSLPLRNLLISSCYILTASQEPPHLFLLHSHCLSGTSSSLLVTFSLPLRNLLISSCYILTASQEPPHLFLLHSHCLSGTSSSLLVTFSLPLRNLLISSCYILTASQEPPHLFLLHSHFLSGTSSSLLPPIYLYLSSSMSRFHSRISILGVTFVPASSKEPVKYLVILDKQGRVHNIKEELLIYMKENPPKKMIIAEVLNNHISKALDDSTPLRHVDDTNRSIYAFEILPPTCWKKKGKKILAKDTTGEGGGGDTAVVESMDDSEFPSLDLDSLTQPSLLSIGERGDGWKSCAICLEEMDKDLRRHTSCNCILCESCIDSSCRHHGGDELECPMCRVIVKPDTELVPLQMTGHSKPKVRLVDVSLVFRLDNEGDGNNNQKMVKLFGHPKLVRLPNRLMGHELYEAISKVIPYNFIAPYSILFVDGQGYRCSRCMFTKHCRGCQVTSEGEVLLRTQETLAVRFSEPLDNTDITFQHSSMKKLRPQEPLSLYDCLHAFSESEQLDEHNPWYCPICQKNQCATKTLSVWRYPDFLIIYLKRFIYHDGGSIKLDNKVTFPLTGLAVTPPAILHHRNNLTYNLYACVCHYGGSSAGHYTAYSKNPRTGDWHHFNDENVAKQRPQEEDYSNAYILFYQKQGVPFDFNIPKMFTSSETSPKPNIDQLILDLDHSVERDWQQEKLAHDSES